MSNLFSSDDAALPLIWPEEGLKPHRFAGIFRLLVGDERVELDKSIKAKGLDFKIEIYEGAILDGRNRYIGLVDGGLFNPGDDWHAFPDYFTEFRGTRLEALDRVWRLNEERRHDSPGERAMAAARKKVLIEEELGEDAAKLRKTDRELAAEHGVSERLLNSANAVIGTAEPEIVQAVDEGRVSVTDAAEAARLEREAQVEIAQSPDRKTAKRKVQAAKAPDLPAPLSRTDLATFGEGVLNLAHATAEKHGGPGASISADKLLKLGRDLGLLQNSAAFGFSRPMLLALGKLRDTMPTKPVKKADKPEEPSLFAPTAPPLGGEWGQNVGGMKPKYTAGFSVFHEEDDTFSISVSLSFATRSSAGPFYGSFPTFHEAVAAAAGAVHRQLQEIAVAADSTTTEAEKASADAGLGWLDMRLARWGITLPDPVEQVVDQLSEIVDAMVDRQLSYDELVARQAELKGKHTRATAEPILRAGEAAHIPVKQQADDLGHAEGTVSGWRAKLKLQQHERLGDVSRIYNAATGAAA